MARSKVHESTVSGINFKLFDLNNDQTVDGIQNIDVNENGVSISFFSNKSRTSTEIEHEINSTIYINQDQFIAMANTLHREALRLARDTPRFLSKRVA